MSHTMSSIALLKIMNLGYLRCLLSNWALSFLIFAMFANSVNASEHDEPPYDIKKINQIYQDILKKTVTNKGKELTDFANFKITEDHLRLERKHFSKVLFVDAPILIWLNSKTLEVLEFSNGTFFDYIEKNKNKNSRIIPKISSREAVQRTLDYLKALNIEVPHNYQLNDISYNTTSSERWYIRWELANNNVTLDVGDGSTPFAFTTILDEDYGLSLVSLPIALPSIPQQVEQLSREEAILKAFDCVPYVIDTSYFKQFRGEGYGMQSLLGIKKCYNMPNWMLDPKRSTYLNKDDPPHEIRLCWKVDIVTSDITPKIAEGKKSARYPVVVSVYLDITTGDCVGAIFK